MDSPPQLLVQAVNRETSGKKVLWSARPDAWGYARNRWARAWIGLPFTAFAVFWTWGASGGLSSRGKSEPVFFVLWGVMFIVMGVCIALSPLYAFWKARRVFYIVTDRGALIFEKGWTLKIHYFDASGFGGFERVSRGDTFGDILFERRIQRRGKRTSVIDVGFLGLRDYVSAEEALRRMMTNG